MTREIVYAFAVATLLSGCPKQTTESVVNLDAGSVELPSDEELDASELPEAGDTSASDGGLLDVDAGDTADVDVDGGER